MLGALRGDDDARCFWISWFLVHPDFRGARIGQALSERLWTDLRLLHATTHPTKSLLVGFCTGISNTMRRLYEREGYARLGPKTFLNDYSPWDMFYFKGKELKIHYICFITIFNKQHKSLY